MVENWLILLFLSALFGVFLLLSLRIKNEAKKQYYKIFMILLALVFVKNIIPLFSAGFIEFFSNKTTLSYLLTSVLGDIVNIVIIIVLVFVSTIIVKKVQNKNEK